MTKNDRFFLFEHTFLCESVKCVNLSPPKKEKRENREKNEEKMNFVLKKFGQFKKKQYLCTAVPVIPLPDMMLVMNPGFLFVWLRVN